jgi:hypothetical protein
MPFQGDGCGHPWPCPLPAAWLFDSSDGQPLRYVQVEPTAVAEVDVDAAVDPPGRWRHRQRFVRTRVELPAVLVPRWGPDGDAT